MSDIKILNTGKTWAHASVGTLKSFEGKQFVKEATGADSCEISFGSLPSGAAVPFFHSHKANEENYIILSGAGKFQVMMMFSTSPKGQWCASPLDASATSNAPLPSR